MTNFRTIDRETGFLLPPSVDEWLPEKHLARFVVEVIDGLDLRAMSGDYRGSGSASYHPRMLLGILVYGYATGVFSSRKLERATYDSVAFRFIAANDHPDHDTIATFRRRFLKEIEALFVEVLLLAREMGVLKMGTIGLDGAKIHANASRHSALSYEHAGKIEARLKAEVADLMAKAEAADAADIPDGMSIPDELARREERLRGIAEARAKIEARARERHARDPRVEARGQTGGARSEGRGDWREARRQAAAGSDRGAAAERSDQSHRRRLAHHARRRRRLRSMLQRAGRRGGGQSAGGGDGCGSGAQRQAANRADAGQDRRSSRRPSGSDPRAETLLADTGCFSGANVEACEKAGVEPLIAMGRQPHHPPLAERFEAPPPALRKSDAGRGRCRAKIGASAENAGRPGSLRPAQTNPGAGVRHHQIRARVPSIFAARTRKSARRVEPRDHGLEHQANIRPRPRPRRSCAGRRREKAAVTGL
jgi:transposase